MFDYDTLGSVAALTAGLAFWRLFWRTTAVFWRAAAVCNFFRRHLLVMGSPQRDCATDAARKRRELCFRYRAL